MIAGMPEEPLAERRFAALLDEPPAEVLRLGMSRSALRVDLTERRTGESWAVPAAIHRMGLSASFTADIDPNTIAAGSRLANGLWDLNVHFGVMGLGMRHRATLTEERRPGRILPEPVAERPANDGGLFHASDFRTMSRCRAREKPQARRTSEAGTRAEVLSPAGRPQTPASVMSDPPRFAALARRAANRLPSPVQTALRQVKHRLAGFSQQSGAALPLLSVVVVATNAESYLIECLHSLRSQTLKRIEVLVVDNGSTDGTAVVAQEIAANDPRFRVIRRPQLGVSASRNAGARLADGRFLAFVDATDTVPRTAYATLINSLRQTGSDFAAGSVRSVIRGRRRRPSWTTISHDLDRLGQTVSEFPLAMLDTCVTNKVFRKPFWDTVVGEFPISAAGASHAIIKAILQARQFDLLQAVSCVQRERLAAGQLLPEPLTASELRARFEWLWATWQRVRAVNDPTIASAWLGGVIDGDLGDLAANAHRADASYRSELQQAAQRVSGIGRRRCVVPGARGSQTASVARRQPTVDRARSAHPAGPALRRDPPDGGAGRPGVRGGRAHVRRRRRATRVPGTRGEPNCAFGMHRTRHLA